MFATLLLNSHADPSQGRPIQYQVVAAKPQRPGIGFQAAQAAFVIKAKAFTPTAWLLPCWEKREPY